MLAKTPIGQRFYRFVASQPYDREYRFGSSGDCACAHFMQEEFGLSSDETAHSFLNYWDKMANCKKPQYPNTDPVLFDIWKQFNEIARDERTYGALRLRLEERMPEVVGR